MSNCEEEDTKEDRDIENNLSNRNLSSLVQSHLAILLVLVMASLYDASPILIYILFDIS